MTDPSASDAIEEEDALEAELFKRLGQQSIPSQSLTSFQSAIGPGIQVPASQCNVPETMFGGQMDHLPGICDTTPQIVTSSFDIADTEMELEVMRRCEEAANGRIDSIENFEIPFKANAELQSYEQKIFSEAPTVFSGSPPPNTQVEFDESLPPEMELELQRRLQAQLVESQNDGRLGQPSQAGLEEDEDAPEIDMDDVEDYLAMQGCVPEAPEESEEEGMVCGQRPLASEAVTSSSSKRAGNLQDPQILPLVSTTATLINDGPLSKRAKLTGAGQIKASEVRGKGLNAGTAADDLIHQIFSEEEEDVCVEDQNERGLCSNIPRRLAMDVAGPCMSVTSALSGCRVYCTKGDNDINSLEERSTRMGRPSQFTSFLDKPVSVLIRQLDDERLAQVLSESEKASHAVREISAFALEGDLELGAQETPIEVGHDTAHVQERQLWVNKYEPRSFSSLLSDEATNREVAKWIKSWDSSSPALCSLSALGAKGGNSAMGRGSWGQRGSKQALGYGQDRKQEQAERLLLISGPPGLGKTTLAHVVAKHCGYHPFEINASDDRSAASLTQKVKDAVQMQAVVGGGRPNCVIIDEIDGATGGTEGSSAITALLRIASSGTRGEEAGSSASISKDYSPERHAAANKTLRSSNGRRDRQSTLRRPIICICNDLYAPALRPLREAARLIHFRAPNRERLLSRLLYICEKEGVRADKQALGALCDRTECDIRCCINTLQFMARQHHQKITLRSVEQIAIGAKDATKGAFSLWNYLLQARSSHRSSVAAVGRCGGGGGSGAGMRMMSLWDSLNMFGEQELVLNGLFENLHSVRFIDINFKKTSSMADRLSEADSLLRRVRQNNEYNMMQYIVPQLLYCHLTAAQPERPKIVWPKAQAEASRKQATSVEVIRSWFNAVTPAVAQAHSRACLSLEVLPALKHILSPPIRALSAHLLSPEEHIMLMNTVGVLLDYSLSYDLAVAATQESQGSHRPGMRPVAESRHAVRALPLKPAVDMLHVFSEEASSCGQQQAASSAIGRASGPHAAAARQLPLVLRQMITQQANQEAIRRAEVIRNRGLDCEAQLPVEEGQPLGDKGETLMTTHIKQGPSLIANGNKQQGSHALPVKRPKSIPPAVNKPVKENWLDVLRQKSQGSRRPQKRAAVKSEAATDSEASHNNQELALRASCNNGQIADFEGKTSTILSAGDMQFTVLYRFNEGYTNAVKKPLLIRDLL
ncbi:hypothetical protein CEUSTIGMA_g1393.t1 [Chlamydomonas eustigma]|uniref:AAA+ ATPase domain-containing protein n=1 Tax=Chlamydomonas eustigma TaxID=1157962 RepID=A0A250WSZ7_9CHLO|nr:hypothetical protein CEUSTIGMA_g1393.t1 [Chlamydomonas eustigma]|eukprot:GAX73943.1 hypothetical protein CEUSTIGMA_g1393.t1 [Chlamydomonas eustigma]